jgi:hypothetical protein
VGPRAGLDNLTCVFLVSRHLALLLTPSKFFRYFCGQKRVYPAVLPKNFTSVDASSYLPFFLRSKFRFNTKERGEPMHYVICS